MLKTSVHHKKILGIMSLLLLQLMAWSQYRLSINVLDNDSTFIIKTVRLQTSFRNRAACAAYIDNLPASLRAKGYPVASIDSIHFGTQGSRQIINVRCTAARFLKEVC